MALSKVAVYCLINMSCRNFSWEGLSEAIKVVFVRLIKMRPQSITWRMELRGGVILLSDGGMCFVSTVARRVRARPSWIRDELYFYQKYP